MSDTSESTTASHDLAVFAVADYLISLDELRAEPDVTPMKLAKLLYLAQGNYLAATGYRMFDEPVEAYEHGPVVHREWKRHPGRQIIAAAFPDSSRAQTKLPDDATDFLETLWSLYGDRSATDLRRLTHDQDPWRDNYREQVHRPVIPDGDMTTYFRERVPAPERVFHPGIVIMPDGFLDEGDADAFAARYAEFTGR